MGSFVMSESAKSDAENLMADWLKSSGDFWASAMKNSSQFSSAASEKSGAKNRYLESLETMQRIWQSISSTLNDPKVVDAILQGVNALPEFSMTLVKAGWETSSRLQKRAMEKAGKIGQKTEAYNFDNLDQDLFKTWKEVYEEEFQQYFKIPQLGLMRYHQEYFNRFIDEWNLLQATLSEFLFVLYLPVEKSFKVLQDQVEEMSHQGQLPERSKDYYNLWLKILEGHYMNLFKSPEYLNTLRETLDQLQTFTEAKNLLLQDILQSLPVPTNKDMDDMYKELYVLKKQVKALEKKVEELKQPKRVKTGHA
jgi:polyhydroxyalkanoate synthase subunit PhaE